MADLIDRAAVLDALGERPMLWINNDEYTLGARNQYDMDRLAIETVPSIDAVPVVRCGECEYYHPAYCEIWSRFGTVQTRPNGFCYMAERKDGKDGA